MAKRIITISREFGSGGRFIGEEVAQQLGIAYYSENIIDQIAQQSGLSPEYIEENAELSPKKGFFAYAFSGRDITGKSVDDMLYEAQRKVILEIAEKEPGYGCRQQRKSRRRRFPGGYECNDSDYTGSGNCPSINE